MNISRRHLLATTAAAAFVPGVAFAASDTPIDALFAELSEALLVESPEGATSLALDKGKRAALKSRLSDASWAHAAHDHVFCSDWLAKLKAVPAAGLSPDAALNKAVTEYALELGRDGGRFAFGVNTLGAAMSKSAGPYVVSQQSGSYVSTANSSTASTASRPGPMPTRG